MKTVKKRGSKKSRDLISKGGLNCLIDDAINPLVDTNIEFVLVDEFLYMVVERNLGVSIRKFARYSLPQIVEKLIEDL